MRNNLALFTDRATTLILLIVAGITPLLFLNKTTEFYEMPKLAFLTVATVILIGLTILSWILKGKISITRTPLDIPLLAFLAIVLISTYFSGTRIQAIYGDFPTVHGSATAWTVYILLYFVTAANLRSLARIKNFLYMLYGSAALVAFLTILAFFNVFLPFDFTKGVNFTPTGSTFSTIALLTLLLPLPLVLLLMNPKRTFYSSSALILAVLFSVTVALTGSLTIYIVLAIIFGLGLFAAKHHLSTSGLTMFSIPAVLTALTLILVYVPFPGNNIQKLEAAYPKEVQLPLNVSWKISASTFRDAPFFGTGPASYLFNFTTYKPSEFNLKNYWNFSFGTAYDEFLHVLGTLGLLGFFTLIVLCIVIFKISSKFLALTKIAGREAAFQDILLPALAVGGLTGIILLAVHTTTLVSITTTLFIFVLLMMAQDSVRNKAADINLGIKASTSDNKQFDLLPVVLFIVFLVGAVTLLSRLASVVSADYYHRLALSQSTKNGTKTYEYLQKAETMNPYIDLYRVDMAQTNFALANAIAVQKGPSKDNEKGSLTDKDKQTIQTLLSQAINEGRASVTLSPRSSRNWEVLASIYRNITGVANNALTFSLDAYGKAIQRDPLNPAYRFTVGEVYYSIKNYDLAIRFFTDAINLKPDYTNAYYSLALAYREKGDLKTAQSIAEQTLTLIKKDTNPKDYKAVSDLIADLKNKIANTSENNTTTPPAAEQSGLNNNNITGVNVNNLNNPPTISTPSAVQINPNTKLPKPSPAVSPIPTRAGTSVITPFPTRVTTPVVIR